MSVTKQITLHCDASGCDEVFVTDTERLREARRQARCACWRYIPGHPAGPSPRDYCAVCAHLWSTR